jgi:TolB-like protein
MDLPSRIASWLGENQATISAVVEIAATPRSSSFTYQGEALDVKQVSRELGARCIGGLREPGLKE